MLTKIDKNWTLFLDRDGVINIEKNEDYIYNWNEFIFYEDSLKAIEVLSKIFNKIIIVTNQKGVGKKLMTENDVTIIHENMLNAITESNGKITKIYFCGDLANDSINRKPNIGMALQAKNDYCDIDFKKSIMVGNRLTDMQFGKNAGMKTIYLNTTHPLQQIDNNLIDASFNSLFEFAIELEKSTN